MANAMPWSVRGIDPEIREQAVEAAHRSGMSVGEWLNHVLAGNLDEEDVAPRPRSKRRPSRLDELNDRLEKLARPRTATAAHRAREPEAEGGRVLDLIETAVQAIERLERSGAQRQSEPVAARPDLSQVVDMLERRLGSMSEPAMPEMAAAGGMRNFRRPTRADGALARAVSEIDQRRRDLESGGARPRVATRLAEPAEHPFEAMRTQLDGLLQRIDEMRQTPRQDTQSLQDRLEQIAGKMEDLRSRPSEDLALIRRDLASLGAAIETLSPQRLVGMVENAVANMAEKSFLSNRNALPERLLAPIADVHQDVRQVLAQLSASRSSDRVSEEIGHVARRLDDIASLASSTEHVDTLLRETEAIKGLIGQAMRSQPLDGLARQIDTLAKNIESFQREPHRADEGAVLDAIQEIRDRIERIDPNSTFSVLEQRLGAIANIEKRLDSLAQDVSRIAKDTQPLPQLDEIASRLERIDRVLDGSKEQPLAGLDHLVEKMDRLGSTLEKAAPGSGTDELMAMLERLSSRMADVEAARADSRMLDALQAEIAQLGRKLESPAIGGAPGLQGLESTIATLTAQFEAVRTDMQDAAQSAAEKAAREAIRSVARDDSTDTLAAEGLLLLKRDLGEFKSAQTEADRRTRQTLEQLHSTLETLVGRLSQMESTPAPVRSSAPVVQAPAPASRDIRPDIAAPRAEPQTAMPRMDAPTKPAASQLAPRSTAPVADVIGDVADLPLEPGQRPGQGSPAQTLDSPAPSTDPRSNFIAAARRAAQAAAEKSQEVLAEEKPDRKARKAARAVASAEASAGGNTPSLMVRARKPILLGLAALVFTLGAMKVLLTRNGAETVGTQPAQKPVIEQSAPAAPAAPAGPAAPAAAPEREQLPERTGAIPVVPGDAANGSKRGTRLSDSSVITQADPLTVGSINSEGASRPIETGRQALAELGRETRIQGLDRLRDAAVGGNISAIFELGSRLADGRGAARDPKLAARWFEQAAAAGHAPAQYRLASLYREGRGVTRDAAIAFQWFDRAAAQGHVLAMHNAGVLLAEGVHGSPDYAGAALWFRRAAEHGVKDSQFNVGILFARGLGVNQDLGEAFRWFSLAAAQGDQDAVKKRDDVAARLPKDQLNKEREKLKAFAPTKPNPAANDVGPWDNSPTAMFPPIGRAVNGPAAPAR